MDEFESLRTSFDEVATLYNEVRPGYREDVINDIIEFAELPALGRILEVGCGTGQITIPFAARGYPVLALEPGAALAAIASTKCEPYPKVRILNMSFENWPVEAQGFNLVLSAQAFHWIEPVFGCEKSAVALAPRGTIALVWNKDISQDTAFYKATQPVYEMYMPAESSSDSTRSKIQTSLRDSGYFLDVQEIHRPWEKTYSSTEYLNLLETYSDHHRLPEPVKTRFFQALLDVINMSGGVVTRKHETQILLARRG